MNPLTIDKFTIEQFIFAEGTGTSLQGVLGSPATLTSSGAWNSSTPSGIGYSLNLNGGNGVYVSSTSLLTGPLLDLTIALWVKPSVALPLAASDQRFFSKFGNPNYPTVTDGFDLCVNGTSTSNGNAGALCLTLWKAGASTKIQTSSPVSISANAWHRIAVVISCIGIVRLYLDGVKVAEATSLSSPYSVGGAGAPFTLGTDYTTSASGGVPGLYAELLLESRPWTGAEILADYQTSQRYPTIPTKMGSPQIFVGGNGVNAGQEMNVLPNLAGSGYVHTFSRGWNVETIHFGTSPDGIAITDLGTLVGNGVGGESATQCGRSFLAWDSSSNLHLFYSNTESGSSNLSHNTINTATGAVIGSPNVILSGTLQSWMGGTQNGCIIRKPDGTCAMLLECSGSSTHWHWQIGLFTSPNLTSGGTWTAYGSNPLTGLTAGSWNWFSGPSVRYETGTYHLFYHLSPDNAEPSVLMYATSPDLITWTKQNDGLPIGSPFSLSVLPAADYALSQRADPEWVQLPNATALFHEDVDNNGIAIIRYQMYPGTLKQLVTDGSYAASSIEATVVNSSTGTTNVSNSVDGHLI